MYYDPYDFIILLRLDGVFIFEFWCLKTTKFSSVLQIKLFHETCYWFGKVVRYQQISRMTDVYILGTSPPKSISSRVSKWVSIS